MTSKTVDIIDKFGEWGTSDEFNLNTEDIAPLANPLEKEAPKRSAPERSAPERFALARSAPERSASERFAPERSAHLKTVTRCHDKMSSSVLFL